MKIVQQQLEEERNKRIELEQREAAREQREAARDARDAELIQYLQSISTTFGVPLPPSLFPSTSGTPVSSLRSFVYIVVSTVV
jgi:hypothetical protein